MEESRSPEPELEPGDRYSDEEQVIQEETTSGKEEEEERDDWKLTINEVVPAVVVLQVTTCRSFDTEQASSGSATGFIVDKKRGIILTNRHVVRPGPVVAQAIFVNHEEFPVRPVYIDPVHDFGFFQYDPDAIQFLEYEEITLAPEAACVGLEIRVIGNDSREKVLANKDPMRRQVLRVKRCFAGSKAEKLLKEGDMLLAINNEPVTCFRDLENACLAREKFGAENQKLSLMISRQGREVELQIETDIRDGNATTRIIHWSGCILHEPHLAVCSLGFLPKEGHGVYVSRTFSGTPAVRYGLHALRWIVEVNGKRTPNLDDFINVTKDLRYDEFVCLRTIDLNGRPQVLTLKQDLHYWPTWELMFDSNTGRWCRQTIKEIDCSNL